MAFKMNVSKYRHTTGKVDKRELWYPDINTSGSSAASTFIKANTKYIAVNWQSGNGVLGIIPLRSVGKRKGEVYTVHAHATPLNDFEFNPFNVYQIATAAEEGVKVWTLPTSGLTEPATLTQTLTGQHAKGVDAIAWNPVASSIIATASADKTIKVWDVESGEVKYTLECDNAVTGISWNYDGTLLAAVGKDLKNRVFDVRNSTVVSVGDGHQGVKPSRVVWLGNTNYILTAGFSKMRERQLSMWDHRDLSKAIKTVTLDSSTGIITPVYDVDAALLFITGSGDSATRLFDMNTQFSTEPAFQELAAVTSDTPAKGICLIPKLALDVMEVEIDRVLKITANNIVPITYSMARKSKSSFADDLFPNTQGLTAALTNQEWLEGQVRQPILTTLDPSSRPREQQQDDDNSNNNQSSGSSTFSSVFDQQLTIDDQDHGNSSSLDSSATSSPTLAGSGSGESPVPDNITRTGIIPKIVRTSKYRHVVGTPLPKIQQYTNLKVSGNTSNTTIAANATYFAVPWVGTGGPLAVIPIAQVGRQVTVPCIELGSQLLDYDLSQFHQDIVATGGEDSHIKIWKVPQGGLPKNGKNYTQYEHDLIGHNRRIVSVAFHPTADNVLISTGGDQCVKLWDVEQGKERFSFDGYHSDMITSVNVSIEGDKFLTSCKDKMMRVFDPRSNKLISEQLTHNGVKGGKAIWLGKTGNILTVGFNKSSEREYQLWDSRNLGTSSSQPIATGVFDHLAGIITPYYDEDTGVVFLAGKGDGSIRMMEINDSEPYVHFLTEYNSGTPQMGVSQVAFKQGLNVKKCELTRFFKVSDSVVEQISVTVPRNRMEFFQDDIYPPTRASKPAMSASDWFSGTTREPSFVSLCPPDMTPLSNAPPPPKKEREIIRETVVDTGPSRDKVINTFLDRVQSQSREGTLKVALSEKKPLFVDDEPCVSDSEWD